MAEGDMMIFLSRLALTVRCGVGNHTLTELYFTGLIVVFIVLTFVYGVRTM